MPNGERIWPDLDWTPGELSGEATATCEYGVYERQSSGTIATTRVSLGEAGVEATTASPVAAYKVTFNCACCGTKSVLGDDLGNNAAYRACVDHYHLVCERAAAEIAAISKATQ